jgi:hypothetical protein
MADIKISALPAVTSVASNDILPVVASSSTSKITVQSLSNSLTQVSSSISASFATTASYVLGGGNTVNTSSFVTTGSASSTQSISGSVLISGSLSVSGQDITLISSPSYPIIIGNGSGNSNARYTNVAFGYLSLSSNTSGFHNTALGYRTLDANIGGSNNTAVGNVAGYSNTSGESNTFIGYSSGFNNTIGGYNIAIGSNAMYSNTIASYNIGIGINSLYFLNGNGTNNVAIGYEAGASASGSSSANVYIGNQAGPSSNIIENNKLYIANAPGNPLIGGDFEQRTATISGSLLISGSIIPAVSGVSSTSSFNLGSATNAWKDIYVSDGTINFINGVGAVQGTLSSISGGLQLGNSIVSGNLDISGSIGFVDSLNTSLYGADYISGRYLAGTPTYRGIFNPGFTTGSIQPVISTDWTVSYAVVGSGIFGNTKYVTSDLGIGLEYNNFQSPAKASPAIKIAYNSAISEFNSTTNIYEAGYSTIITNNRNMSNVEPAIDWSYQFGTYHALTVTGSFLSRDNTNLGTTINNYSRVTGRLLVTGSTEITGSATISQTLNLKAQDPLPTGQLGSLAVSASALYFHNGAAWKEVSLVP